VRRLQFMETWIELLELVGSRREQPRFDSCQGQDVLAVVNMPLCLPYGVLDGSFSYVNQIIVVKPVSPLYRCGSKTSAVCTKVLL
jgi:hypothetical protein